jgi:Uma2 family endonuclease
VVTTGTHRHHRYSYSEYLALEEGSLVRHEFLDGEIYAMAGGTPTHAALAANIIRLVGAQLPPRCRAYTSDLRVRVPATGLSTYPDVSVVCGQTIRAVDDRLAVTNPLLVVEVTSASTEEYDRREKVGHYQQLPSLQEIMVVSHREAELVVHRRNTDGPWEVTRVHSGQAVQLASIDVTLAVDEVYRDRLEDADDTRA